MSTFPAPLEPPFAPEIAELLGSLMPRGAEVPPIALFRFFALHPALARAMHPLARHVLGKAASLPARDRELAILRATARAGCSYEWGVHVAFFAARAGLDGTAIDATASGDGSALSARDALVVRAVDAIHERATLDDALRDELARSLSAEEILELLLLAGWYRTIAGLANAARLADEPWAPGLRG